MSDGKTIRLLRAYNQNSPLSMFLTSLFQSPEENFHNSESVEIDIWRTDEDVAVVINDLSQGYRYNSYDLYTNKRFTPPIFQEAFSVNAFDLLDRVPGQNPFGTNDFQANAATRVMKGSREVQNKILRAIEWQAAQVLQTGVIDLIDANGDVLYNINYAPKPTHFPTAAIDWNAAGSTKLEDLEALAEEIRNDGKEDPDQLIMGSNAFNLFIQDDAVQKVFDNRRIDQGAITPMQTGGTGGGNFRGVVEIGNYKYDIWTYGGRYKDPQTGDKVQYIDPDKVIVRSSRGRLDATFGGIPTLVPPDQRVIQYLPERVNEGGRVGDMHLNAWVTPDGRTLMASAGSRPLMIPTAIDTYGCLTTIAP